MEKCNVIAQDRTPEFEKSAEVDIVDEARGVFKKADEAGKTPAHERK